MAALFRKANITVGIIDKLAPGETVMDTKELGLGIRRQDNARVFFVRKHVRGARHYETLGEYGTGGLTVTTARERTKDVIAALRAGSSPADRRARERATPTVAELADEWLVFHVDAKLKRDTAAIYRSSLRVNILPHLGRLRVDIVTDIHAAQIHHAARARPYAANKALAILSKMMGYAERKGLRPRGTNPVTGLERFREEKRERFLSRGELARLGAALNDPEVARMHSSFALAAIKLLLLTGARLREALNLRWHEVDLERGLLFLGDSKTGKKAIILGAHAIQQLSAIPRTSSTLVFPGLKPDRPMYDVRKTWARVTAAAKLDGVRVHDLRHTFASYSAGVGGSLPMIGHLLGHSQAATTARYAHLAATPVRDLANRASSVIAIALGDAPAPAFPRATDER